MNHFHIRWSNGNLDWESYRTRAEAELGAKKLMQYEETYAIEEHGGSCPRCPDVVKMKLRQANKLGENESSAD